MAAGMGDTSASQGAPKAVGRQQKLGKGMEQIFPGASRRNQPDGHLAVGLLALRTARVHFCYFKALN